MTTKSEEHVHTLIERASKAHGAGEAMQFAQAACNAGNALAAVTRLPERPDTAPDVKAMVERFLRWKLPATFNPDNGIAFSPPTGPNLQTEWPSGTNLLDYTQAEAMVRHILGLEAA